MEHNPYAAPTVAVGDTPDAAEQQELAGKGRRFVNLIVDSTCDQIGLTILIFISAFLAPKVAEAVSDSFLLSLLLSFSWMICYYVGFESLSGRTIGKLLTGTRVVSVTGGRPSVVQIMKRTLTRMVPFEPFSCLSDPPIGWHDQWSGTRVIRNTPGNSLGAAYALHNSVDEPPTAGTLGLR